MNRSACGLIRSCLSQDIVRAGKKGKKKCCKSFLESDEKITTKKTTFPSSYKGGRMLNLESSLCLMLVLRVAVESESCSPLTG